jgi:hypothetical protein
MNHTQWLDYFNKNYYPKLNPDNIVRKKGKLKTPADRGVIDNLWQRGDGFRFMFNELFSIKENDFTIVETGTLRKENNWSDGQSCLIFSDLVEHLGGKVLSVDINPDACNTARRVLQNKKVTITESDSLEYLRTLDLDNVDLFYLDSYDCKWGKDQLSAEHHLNEFKIIEPYLKNCIVAIDDNTKLLESNTRTGKGRLIYDYLKEKNIMPLYDDYQIVYKFL